MAQEDDIPAVEVINDTNGFVVGLYRHLWMKNGKGQPCADVNIPHTVVFQLGKPMAWYFTSAKDHMVRRKLKANVNGLNVVEAMTAHVDPSITICGVFTGCMTVPLAERALRPSSASHSPRRRHPASVAAEEVPEVVLQDRATTHLSPLQVRLCLAPALEQKQEALALPQLYDGVLQKFVEPRGEYNFAVKATWSPQACVLERRVNKARLIDARVPLPERLATFEGALWLTDYCLVSGNVMASRVEATCNRVAAHLHDVSKGRIVVARMELFFKVDDLNRLWLTHCCGMKLDMQHIPKIIKLRTTVRSVVLNPPPGVANGSLSFSALDAGRPRSAGSSSMVDLAGPAATSSAAAGTAQAPAQTRSRAISPTPSAGHHGDDATAALRHAESARAVSTQGSRRRSLSLSFGAPPLPPAPPPARIKPFACVVTGETYAGDQRCEVTYKMLLQQWYWEVSQIANEQDRLVATDAVPPTIRRAEPNLTRQQYLKMRSQPMFLYQTAPVCPEAAARLATDALRELGRDYLAPGGAAAAAGGNGRRPVSALPAFGAGASLSFWTTGTTAAGAAGAGTAGAGGGASIIAASTAPAGVLNAAGCSAQQQAKRRPWTASDGARASSSPVELPTPFLTPRGAAREAAALTANSASDFPPPPSSSKPGGSATGGSAPLHERGARDGSPSPPVPDPSAAAGAETQRNLARLPSSLLAKSKLPGHGKPPSPPKPPHVEAEKRPRATRGEQAPLSVASSASSPGRDGGSGAQGGTASAGHGSSPAHSPGSARSIPGSSVGLGPDGTGGTYRSIKSYMDNDDLKTLRELGDGYDGVERTTQALLAQAQAMLLEAEVAGTTRARRAASRAASSEGRVRVAGSRQDSAELATAGGGLASGSGAPSASGGTTPALQGGFGSVLNRASSTRALHHLHIDAASGAPPPAPLSNTGTGLAASQAGQGLGLGVGWEGEHPADWVVKARGSRAAGGSPGKRTGGHGPTTTGRRRSSVVSNSALEPPGAAPPVAYGAAAAATAAAVYGAHVSKVTQAHHYHHHPAHGVTVGASGNSSTTASPRAAERPAPGGSYWVVQGLADSRSSGSPAGQPGTLLAAPTAPRGANGDGVPRRHAQHSGPLGQPRSGALHTPPAGVLGGITGGAGSGGAVGLDMLTSAEEALLSEMLNGGG